MKQLNHQDYYVIRAAAARNLAQWAVTPAIAAIHAKMAVQYERVANQPDKGNDVIVTVI
jgi:hypothetical protein